MTHQSAMVFLHWFWTAFFALFGVYLATRCRNYLSAASADCGVKIATDSAQSRERLNAAVERRESAEGKPVPLGIWLGGISLLLAAVAATGRVQPALLYACLCLGFSLAIAAVFLRIRNSQPTRVAVLNARKSDSVIPSYWFFVACLGALSVLTYSTNAQYRGASVMVALSSLLTVAIAWRLTNLPAILTGADISAEQIVDDRLRFYRSRSVMVFAVVQTFVFASQVIGQSTTLQSAAYTFTFVLWIAFAIWMLRKQFSAVRLA